MSDVFDDPDVREIYGGDYWVSAPYEFGHFEATLEDGSPDTTSPWVPDDLTSWGGWLCQWRPSDDAADSTIIELTVNLSQAGGGILSVSATSEQTRAMQQSGVFDVQATTPVVRTFFRVNTFWRLDVSR